MQKQADPRVLRWLDDQASGSMATAAVCVFEAKKGFLRMQEGRRKRGLISAFGVFLEESLGGRVLPLTHVGAEHAAASWVAAEQAGRRGGHRDALIAGTAAEHGATVVTRNVKHFEHADISLVNPWEA